jgi:hypothetical protein
MKCQKSSFKLQNNNFFVQIILVATSTIVRWCLDGIYDRIPKYIRIIKLYFATTEQAGHLGLFLCRCLFFLLFILDFSKILPSITMQNYNKLLILEKLDGLVYCGLLNKTNDSHGLYMCASNVSRKICSFINGIPLLRWTSLVAFDQNL